MSVADSMDRTQPEIFQINLKKIIRARPEWYFRHMPGFLISILEKIIRQDEINQILQRIGHLKNFEFIEAAIRELNMEVETEGEENIPNHPNLIFVGNHALGGADFLALMHVLKDKFDKVYHLTNDVLMTFEQLRDFFVPVNVFGKNPEKYRRILEEKLEKGDAPISLFPAGEVARFIDGRLDDGLWRSGFVRFARKYGRSVVPFYIPTRNSSLFYKVHKIRTKLGIKANLELFLLPSELLKMRNRKVKIIFGKPLPPSFFQNDMHPHDMSARVKEIVYALGEKKEK